MSITSEAPARPSAPSAIRATGGVYTAFGMGSSPHRGENHSQFRIKAEKSDNLIRTEGA